MERRAFRGMNYRRCGHSGLWLSEVGLGLWKWGDPDYDGSRIGEHEGFAVLDRALELGVTHWDTANSYNAGSGNSERLVGRFLAARPRSTRDQIVLATKVRNSVREAHELDREFSPNESGASRKYIVQAVDACLRRLQTDYIDVLYHHRPNLLADGSWETPLDETWSALDDLVRQGKVRYLAVSNRDGAQLEEENETLGRVAGAKASRIIALQNRYNLVDRADVSYADESESDFLSRLERDGVGLIPMVPLAVGFLTGRYRRGELDPEGRLATDSDARWAERYLTETNFGVLEEVERIATARDASIAQIAIAWLLSHEQVPSVIAGVTSQAQLEDNAAATSIELDDSEISRLDELTGA